MSTAKFNTWLNPDGTQNYKCRAWVNFNGTGTVAIRAAGNVTSITDLGTGWYTVNFTNAMPDTNFIVCGLPGQPAAYWGPAMDGGAVNTTSANVSTQRRATSSGNNEAYDYTTVNVAIFR